MAGEVVVAAVIYLGVFMLGRKSGGLVSGAEQWSLGRGGVQYIIVVREHGKERDDILHQVVPSIS